MKTIVTAVMLGMSCAAWAGAPQYIDCPVFARIGQDAAEARDSGKTLWAAQTAMNDKYHWDVRLENYRDLVDDVYKQDNLVHVQPGVVYRAAEKACEDWNVSERTRIRKALGG